MKPHSVLFTLTAAAALLGGLAVVYEVLHEDDASWSGNGAPLSESSVSGSPHSLNVFDSPRAESNSTAVGRNQTGYVGPSTHELSKAGKMKPASGPSKANGSIIGSGQDSSPELPESVKADGYRVKQSPLGSDPQPLNNRPSISYTGSYRVASGRALVDAALPGTGNTVSATDPNVPEPRPEVVESDEPLVTPLEVIQTASHGVNGLLELSYAIMVDDDPSTITPNGLILTQEIPEGWQVVEAEPRLQAVDEQNRMVKWLFVGQDVESTQVYSLSMRLPAGVEGDWNRMLAWYTYRQPDGNCVDVAVGMVPESDIQPGN